jgi:hypothetical protein
MRSIKEIFEKREEGLYPCRYPGCRDYGNTADRHYGVVCSTHTEIITELAQGKVLEPVAG